MCLFDFFKVSDKQYYNKILQQYLTLKYPQDCISIAEIIEGAYQ